MELHCYRRVLFSNKFEIVFTTQFQDQYGNSRTDDEGTCRMISEKIVGQNNLVLLQARAGTVEILYPGTRASVARGYPGTHYYSILGMPRVRKWLKN